MIALILTVLSIFDDERLILLTQMINVDKENHQKYQILFSIESELKIKNLCVEYPKTKM